MHFMFPYLLEKLIKKDTIFKAEVKILDQKVIKIIDTKK